MRLIEIAVGYAVGTALVLAIIGGFGMILGQNWWSRLFTFWWRRVIGGPPILVATLAIWVLNQIFRAPRRQQGHGHGHGAGHGGGGH